MISKTVICTREEKLHKLQKLTIVMYTELMIIALKIFDVMML